MDTDNLTDMAYQTIILANDATDVLKCELGVLCGKFKSEDEYLIDVLEYLAELAEEPEDYLDAWGLHDVTDVSTFVEQLDKLRLHVQTTLKTPYPKRGAPGF
jgi:hypothetical protein